MNRSSELLKSGIKPRQSFLGFQSEAVWICLAWVVLWFAICFRLGYLPLLQPDEGRNAEVAREMKVSGAWLVPTYDGIAYLDKPAFYFKAVAISLACFGDSETAARLPSAMFGIGLLGLTYLFCRREYGVRCAALAAIVLATTPLFLVNARTVIFDIALCFFTTAAIFAGFRAEEAEGRTRRVWYLVGAAAAGFATLVKGPVGFLVPGLVLLVFHRVLGRRGVGKRFFAPLNLLVFFGVVLAWFVPLSLAHPDFPRYGIIEESFHRFTTTGFHRSKPFYFYGIIVLGLFLPWSFLLPEAVVAAWKSRRNRLRADLLCIVWALVVVIFFSLSGSKLPGYILSATVASGVLVARLFDRAWEQPEGKPARIVRHAATAFLGVCVIAAIAAVFLSTRTRMLARPLGISVADTARFKLYLTGAVVLLVAYAVFAGLTVWKRNARFGFVCFASFPLLLMGLNFGMINVVFSAKSARTLAQQIPALSPETQLACLECFPNGLAFYLGRTAALITNDGDELTSNYILFELKSGQTWPSNLVAVSDFNRWLATREHPVYLVVRQQDCSRLEAIAAARKTTIRQLTPQYVGALLPPS
ncbi:MAG TPA: glycosyltransferase family 39 protein [Candidatus Acidoferrales bacterium]|nr:glycosyltransferase family 39 protein [Candidatus Acidoferrales bacterium]